jgi:hypothetical protein
VALAEHLAQEQLEALDPLEVLGVRVAPEVMEAMVVLH